MRFVDSKSEPLIQLSDVWVGLLSRLYQFLDERSLNYRQIDAVRAAPQLENLRTIKRLIDRADATHKSLLSQTAPPSVVYAREQVLQSLCKGENIVDFSPGLNLNTSPSAFNYIDERYADHRDPLTWSLMTGIQPRR